MDQKEGGNCPLPRDARRELRRCGVGNALFHNELHAYKRMFNEDERMDESYKILLVCLFMQQKQFVVPGQTKKQNDKLDEPLSPILRSKRSEQLFCETDDKEIGKPCNSKQKGKDRLSGKDNDVRTDEAGTGLKDVCKNAGPGLKEGFETPKQRKGKGLLIHYADVNIPGVVGKNRNIKDHVIRNEDDDREDSEQTRDCFLDHANGVKASELEKKRKGEDLFTEHDDQLLRADPGVVGKTRNVKDYVVRNEDDVREDSDQTLRDCFFDQENGVKASKLEKKRKGKDLFSEHDDQLLRADSVKTSAEGIEPHEKQNDKAPQEERSEPPIIIERKDNDDAKNGDDSGYTVFLKLMDEALPNNAATGKNEEGAGSKKEIEPEPERKSTTTVKPNGELPIQVPDPVKRSDVENLRNDGSEKAEIEKCSARQSRKSILEEPSNKGEDEHMEIERRLRRRLRKVVYKDPSDEDEDEREEIEKHPSCKVGKNRTDEKVKADIEKCSSRRLRKVSYREPNDEDVDEDEREDMVKHPMKNPQDKNEKANDIEKRSSRRSNKVTEKEPSDEYDDGEEVMEKRTSREVGNIFTKNPLDKNEKADDIEKRSSRRSSKVTCNDLSSNGDERETKKLPSREVRNVATKKPKNKNVEADVEKFSSRRPRKLILEETSDEDENTEIQKHSSREVRNVVMKKHNDEKPEDEIEKQPSHRLKKVFYKDHSSGKDEDEKEKIEKCSSCKVRNNVVMKKSKIAEAEKLPSRRSREGFYKDYLSNDERAEIEKCSSCEVRNTVFMKKSKNARAEIEKLPSRRSREVFYTDYSSSDEREEIKKRSSRREVRNNVFMNKSMKVEDEFEKLPSRRSREVFYKNYSSNDEREEFEKRSSRKVTNNVFMKKSKHAEDEIEKPSSRRSREVFYKDYSSNDEREEIEKCSCSKVRNNVFMKKSKNAEDEIEKPSSSRSREVFYADYSSNDERKEIEKRSSRPVRYNVVMKKSKRVEDEIEKLFSRRSRDVFYRDYPSNDERDKIKKRSSREFRNDVVMKKSKKAEAEIEKLPSRRSRYKDYSSDENYDVEIKKHASRQLWKAIWAGLSDKDKDAFLEIERRSSREVKNVALKKHKNEKAKDEIKKRSSHQSRKVAYKECSSNEDEDMGIEKSPLHGSGNACSPNESTNETGILLVKRKPRDDRKVTMKRLRDEDIEEQIERLRNYLVKRSRYEIEGRKSHNFRVGESSAHPKKAKEDSLEKEDDESSDYGSELEILDKNECLKGPFVTAKTKACVDLNDESDCYKSSEECMEFRGLILEVISKPYDKSEYNDLYAEFREQCYPDHHPDLADKLKMNRWRPRKRLALLRGFFFWLQNLMHNGSFKPWTDSVCLDVEPEWPVQTRQSSGNRLGK